MGKRPRTVDLERRARAPEVLAHWDIKEGCRVPLRNEGRRVTGHHSLIIVSLGIMTEMVLLLSMGIRGDRQKDVQEYLSRIK